jgi:cation:H+ antiporter
MVPVLLLLVGLLLAALGGDRFVYGAVGLAGWLRIPSGIVGATVAAFATSSPELTVGVFSALDGRSELAFGDATGSNMVNLSVVLGIALLLGAIYVRWRDVSRDLVAFIASVVVLSVMSLDGSLSRLEASALLLMFGIWIAWVVREARAQRSDVALLGDVDHRAIIRDVAVGLVLLIAAGRLIVIGAKEIGDLLGWNQFVVGTVIVAVGTSVPELVTIVIAARRGHVGLGLGAVLGSNIFNSLFIVGIAGAISPIAFDRIPALIALVGSLLAGLVLIPGRSHRIGRARGLLLLSGYVGFLAALLVFGGA